MRQPKKPEQLNLLITLNYGLNRKERDKKWKSRDVLRLREMLRGKPKLRRLRGRESRKMPRNRELRKLPGRRESSQKSVAKRRRLSLDI